MTDIEKIKESYERFKHEISEARKNGKDVKIAEIIAMQLPAKIQLAEATGSEKDIEKADELLEAAKKELTES